MSERPSIVLVGWRTAAVLAARRLGLRTIVIYAAAHGDAGQLDMSLADEAIAAERLDSAEELLRCLLRVRLGRCVGIHTQEEWSLVPAALLAQALRVPGPDAGTGARFRDKALQKAAVAGAGLPTAGFAELPDIVDGSVRDRVLDFGMPCVVKPVAGAGTLATYVLTDAGELDRALLELRQGRPERRKFMVEEFVRGDEWHLDGFVRSGKIRFLAVSRYLQSCIEIKRGRLPGSYCLDPVRNPSAYRLAAPLAAGSLAALGLVDGVFHLECFHQQAAGRLVFGECAARIGAGYIDEAVRLKFGVDLYEAGVSLAAGREPALPEAGRDDVVGFTFLPTPPGRLVSCPSGDAMRALPGVLAGRILCRPGDALPDSSAWTAARIGEVVVAAPDVAGFLRRLDGARRWFAERVRVETGAAAIRQ